MTAGKLKVLLSVCCLIILSSCKSIVVRDYDYDSSIQSTPFVIVQLSDIHGETFGFNQKIIINQIKNCSPDLVFLTGDIFEALEAGETGYINIITLLKELSKISPFYFVTGNHEYSKFNGDFYKEIVRNNGGIVLEDSACLVNVKGQSIIIAGVDDPFKDNKKQIRWVENEELYFERVRQTYKSVKDLLIYDNEENVLKILLAHRPEYIENYKKYNFDLIFSGHAHGGQWRIPPFINGLYGSTQGLFPKYAGGQYWFNENSSFIVSRGLTVNHPKIPRVFNSPEIVVVTIK